MPAMLLALHTVDRARGTLAGVFLAEAVLKLRLIRVARQFYLQRVRMVVSL